MIEKGFFSLDIRDYARLEVCVIVYVFWHLCVCVCKHACMRGCT